MKEQIKKELHELEIKMINHCNNKEWEQAEQTKQEKIKLIKQLARLNGWRE